VARPLDIKIVERRRYSEKLSAGEALVKEGFIKTGELICMPQSCFRSWGGEEEARGQRR